LVGSQFEEAAQQGGFVKIGEALFVLPKKRRNRGFTHMHYVFEQNRLGDRRVVKEKVNAPDHKAQRPLSDLKKSDLKAFEKGQIKIADIPYVVGYAQGFTALGYDRRTPRTLVAIFNRAHGQQIRFRFNLFSHPRTDERELAVWPEDINDTWAEDDFYKVTLSRWLGHDVRSRGLNEDLNEIIQALKAQGAPLRALEETGIHPPEI